jgi:hypothetical protein
MDEMTHDPRADRADRAGGSEQARLPFEPAPATPLPFDDEADRPIGFSLTARARRTVAPAALPPLSIIDGETDEDPTDTRPSRARALRRAGADLADIARQLGVDELLVRAWADDVPSHHGRRAAGAARAAAVLAAPASASAASSRARREEESQRRDALDEGRHRLAGDAPFAAGVGLLAGLVATDHHTVSFQTPQAELAGRVIAWLREQADADVRDVHIVLRLGSGVAGDLARHRWAAAVGLSTEQVVFTRWRQATSDDAVVAFVRLTDPQVAARVAGWCEALLHPAQDPADVAF